MPSRTTLILPLVALLLSGCSANPYLKGFTGSPALPLGEGAPVRVVGADRADPIQMQRFEGSLAEARRDQALLGTSTIVSSTPLRDAEAAAAARELGATRVLYNFAYLDSTIERDTQEFRRYSRVDGEHYYDRRSFSTTRHWYEYRAYFFGDNRRQGPTPE